MALGFSYRPSCFDNTGGSESPVVSDYPFFFFIGLSITTSARLYKLSFLYGLTRSHTITGSQYHRIRKIQFRQIQSSRSHGDSCLVLIQPLGLFLIHQNNGTFLANQHFILRLQRLVIGLHAVILLWSNRLLGEQFFIAHIIFLGIFHNNTSTSSIPASENCQNYCVLSKPPFPSHSDRLRHFG